MWQYSTHVYAWWSHGCHKTANLNGPMSWHRKLILGGLGTLPWILWNALEGEYLDKLNTELCIILSITPFHCSRSYLITMFDNIDPHPPTQPTPHHLPHLQHLPHPHPPQPAKPPPPPPTPTPCIFAHVNHGPIKDLSLLNEWICSVLSPYIDMIHMTFNSIIQ